jgi:hypothetical protein
MANGTRQDKTSSQSTDQSLAPHITSDRTKKSSFKNFFDKIAILAIPFPGGRIPCRNPNPKQKRLAKIASSPKNHVFVIYHNARLGIRFLPNKTIDKRKKGKRLQL